MKCPYFEQQGIGMGISTFKGGTHPFDGKSLSKDRAITMLMPKGEMVYPMSQHIGAPAVPCVKKGERVLVGQKIGEAAGFISAPVISSVSGTVKAIEKRLTSAGSLSDCIIVTNDGEYESIEGFGKSRSADSFSKDEIRMIIKEAGIVGLGGAGFPTAVKLTPKDDAKIEYILVNGAECEPYLTSDYRLMLEEPEKLIRGLEIILSLFPNAKAMICIEDNKPEAIAKLESMTKSHAKISVKPLLTKYPQGGERQLIYAATGRKVNSSMLPADVGCVVDNVATVIAIDQAVCECTPLIERVITISGDAVKEPQTFRVRTGMCYEEVIAAAGGFSEDVSKVLSGGPMMGQALFDLKIPVTKTSSSITAFIHDAVAEYPTTACINCGRCVSACPENLIPPVMMKAALHKNIEQFEKVYGMECIECGCCAYVCPARRPLTQAFKQMKREVQADRRARANAERKEKKA